MKAIISKTRPTRQPWVRMEARDVDEHIRNEDSLMAQRVSWLVASQSFLLTGLVAVFAAQLPKDVTAPISPVRVVDLMHFSLSDPAQVCALLKALIVGAGLLSCAAVYVSTLAASLAIQEWKYLGGNRQGCRCSGFVLGLGGIGPLLIIFSFGVLWVVAADMLAGRTLSDALRIGFTVAICGMALWGFAYAYVLKRARAGLPHMIEAPAPSPRQEFSDLEDRMGALEAHFRTFQRQSETAGGDDTRRAGRRRVRSAEDGTDVTHGT